MSVDTTFKPLGPSQVLPATGVQLQFAGTFGGALSVLLVNIGAAVAYVSWGGTAAQAASALPAAPTAGTQFTNSVAVPINGSRVIEVMPGLFFAATAASIFATIGAGGN